MFGDHCPSGWRLAEWASLSGSHVGDSVTRAVKIYEPLYQSQASKAVTAQFAAHLLASGKYGQGKDLMDKLPSYLRAALRHVTGSKDTESSIGKTSAADTTHEGEPA